MRPGLRDPQTIYFGYNVASFQVIMRLTFLILASLCSSWLLAQDTITVDATDAMTVCAKTTPASTPCATAPRAVSKPNPTYSERARKSHREGTVTLNLIVDADGSTRDIRVARSLGDGLDEEAVKTVQQWKFEPGTYEGKPVAVQIRVEINFRLGSAESSPAAASTAQAAREEVSNLFVDAQAAYSRQDYQTSANIARRMTALSPNYSSAWNMLGMSLLELHQLDEAASALEAAVKLDPASSQSYNNLGRVYWRQRKRDEAAAEFQKQIARNPDDRYAHTNLGLVLRDQKKCSLAVPELEKGLTLNPSNGSARVALGDCEMELGDAAKGLSEMEQATSEASSPSVWNSAAYRLAERNAELDRAQKWAEQAVAGESAKLQEISLDHLSTAQLSRVIEISRYWDTLGWVLFQRGDYSHAEEYVRVAWELRPYPVMGYHLARIYEAQGKRDEATRTYALAIAAADAPLIVPLNTDDSDSVADAKERLAKVEPREKAVKKMIEAARADLQAMRTITVSRAASATGSADFTLKFDASGKPVAAHQVAGDAAFNNFAAALQAANFSPQIPSGSKLEIPRRGILTCPSGKSDCSFLLLPAEDAVDLARRESAADAPALAQGPAADPHVYNNPTLGMRVSLPDQWQLISEQPGSYSKPHSAILGKPGAVAFFLLTRERMEGSPLLYSKMLEAGFSQHEEYRRTGDSDVKRDGIAGTRWNIGWKDKGVTYVGIMEFFSVGDDHYRITAMAPTEVYSRYLEDFENMMQSVRFPMLHYDAKILDNPKP